MAESCHKKKKLYEREKIVHEPKTITFQRSVSSRISVTFLAYKA